MKVVIVILLSLALVFGGGLLVYGAVSYGGPATTVTLDLGDLLPPVAPNAYAHEIAEVIATRVKNDPNVGYRNTFFTDTNPSKNPEIFAAEADGWYDVFGKSDASKSILTRYSGADLVGNLLVPITYNHNRAKQFCMAAHFEVEAGGRISYSDKLRIRVQVAPFAVDEVQRSLAWAGGTTSSSAIFRLYYNDQQLESTSFSAIDSYDEDTGTYGEVSLSRPSESGRDRDLDREVPYKTFDLLNLPIYLGGVDKNDDSPLDSSVVDGDSVRITPPTEAAPYYVLTFSEDYQKAQTEANRNGRLGQALGGKTAGIDIKSIEKADFTVEIWEDGVLRRVSADFSVKAKIKKDEGDAKISMTYQFYYDDKSCDLYSVVESVGWTQYLSAANKQEFAAAKSAWNKEAK